MEFLSILGVVLGLMFMMFLCYRGYSIIWVAPVCSMVVCLFSLGVGLGSERNLLTAYTIDYMTGAADYFLSWFPMFLLGAIYGKLMDMTSSAKSLANLFVKLLGKRFAMLAVIIPCMLLTYGGVSTFVVVFVVYPIGYAVYRAADLPRSLLPGVIAYGSFTITMTAIPGSPQIQNLIPIEYFGTTAMAGPIMGIIAALFIGGSGYIYLEWRTRQAKKLGLKFIDDPNFNENDNDDIILPSWHWLAGLLPIIVVFFVMNILGYSVIIALLLAIVTCCVMNIKQYKVFIPSLNKGSEGSLMAIMNTCCAVGFGSVVKISPGFEILTDFIMNSNTSATTLLLSEAIAVNALAGATGSASGGLAIALSALGTEYLYMAEQLGINPDLLHRIAVLASGGLDTLPHNGAVLTLLIITGCTHKESYKDICVTSCIIPVVTSILISILWGCFI